MPLVDRLPPELENIDALVRREKRAYDRREMWRSTYSEAYRFAMPTRETFNWYSPGQEKAQRLYDSTLQEYTYEAANTLCAILFPSWTRWAELAPGGALPKDELPEEIPQGLQKSTEAFFDFLNQSNFASVINECALDLMVGTCSLAFDEGDDTQPFRFQAVPVSSLELEEGPHGTIETTWWRRKPQVQHLTRMYKGLEQFDLPQELASLLLLTPEVEVEVIQGEVYHPESKKYYGIVFHPATRSIIWRFDYGPSCPIIVARASKLAGEVYGRGRVLLALADARTLDKMVEFTLRHSALQIAPPLTGVTDGVLNPYTATLQPNTIIPVGSNDTSNPSLTVLEMGGNFRLTEVMLSNLRERIRRVMLGPEQSEGPIKTATEISVSDRNRLWAMNGEFSRIQAELLSRIVARGIYILQRRGLIPEFKVDGREIVVRYTSPFAKSQQAEDLQALERAVGLIASMGPEQINLGFKTEEFPAWVAKKTGMDLSLIRTKDEREELTAQTQQAMQAVQQAQTEGSLPPEGTV